MPTAELSFYCVPPNAVDTAWMEKKQAAENLILGNRWVLIFCDETSAKGAHRSQGRASSPIF